MFKIDAKELACPLPVIQARKALREHAAVEITVDNVIATENLKKMADQLQVDYQLEPLEGTLYRVTLTQTDTSSSPKEAAPKSEVIPTTDNEATGQRPYLVVINSDQVGTGAKELGSTLMKMFIYSLAEQDQLPDQIIFYNSGVSLTVKDSPVVEDLRELQDQGVKIYACGACLDYYEIKDQLQVGEITNMYHIVHLMREASHIVKP